MPKKKDHIKSIKGPVVQQKNNIFLALITFLISTHSFSMVTSKKQILPEGIKLTPGSLAQLETYQRSKNLGKSQNPFTVEFICFNKKKKSGILSSKLTCKAERVSFTED